MRLGKAPASRPWTDFTRNDLEKLHQALPLACLPYVKLHKTTICENIFQAYFVSLDDYTIHDAINCWLPTSSDCRLSDTGSNNQEVAA